MARQTYLDLKNFSKFTYTQLKTPPADSFKHNREVGEGKEGKEETQDTG